MTLWMMVAFRFVVPVSDESPASVMALFKKGLELAFQDQGPPPKTHVSIFTLQDEDGDQLTVTLEDVPATANVDEMAVANQLAYAELIRAKREGVAGRNLPVAPASAWVARSAQSWMDAIVGGSILL